jgi:hypothetical protein
MTAWVGSKGVSCASSPLFLLVVRHNSPLSSLCVSVLRGGGGGSLDKDAVKENKGVKTDKVHNQSRTKVNMYTVRTTYHFRIMGEQIGTCK